MSSVPRIAVPPHNLEAEKSVLGAVLLDERHLYPLLIEETLRPDHFYREQHGAVFAAMIELYNGQFAKSRDAPDDGRGRISRAEQRTVVTAGR